MQTLSKTLLRTLLVLVCLSYLSQAQSLFFSGGTGAGGDPFTHLFNIDDITTQGGIQGNPSYTVPVVPGWSLCDAGCAGGGNQAPTFWAQTFGVATQSKDGASMSLAMIAQAQTKGTNALETYKIVGDPTASTLDHFITDQWFFCDANCGTYILQLEFDDALFCASSAGSPNPSCDGGAVYSGGVCTSNCRFANGINFMFGFQCDLTRSGGVIEIWNQSTKTWVTATYSGGNIPCTAAGFAQPNTWHHIQKTEHLVAGDFTSCGGNSPTMHYDNITLDSISYTPTNTNTCAGPLNAGWNSVWLIQMQFNIGPPGSSGNTATVYYDLVESSYD